MGNFQIEHFQIQSSQTGNVQIESFQIEFLEVRESLEPITIPTPTPAPDHLKIKKSNLICLDGLPVHFHR